MIVAVPRMLRERGKVPERGLLGHVLPTASPRTYYVVQYWESKSKLYAYAHASDALHRRAWEIFNRKEPVEKRGALCQGPVRAPVGQGAGGRRSQVTGGSGAGRACRGVEAGPPR